MAQSITISNIDRSIEWVKMQILAKKDDIEKASQDILKLEKDLIDLENERTEILQKTTLR